MRERLRIQTEPAESNLSFKRWARSTRELGSQNSNFRENSKGFTTTRHPKTKSHAEIMRISMKTFLTELNVPYPPQNIDKEQLDDSKQKNVKKSSARVTPEFTFFLKRVDKTVGKLRMLNEKLQKSFVLSNPQSSSGLRGISRGSQMNVLSPTSIQLTSSHSLPSAKSKDKINFPEYREKDFEDPDSNLSLIEAIRLIDSNKKSDAVAEAMWQDLGEGYKMHDYLIFERKRKEKEMHSLQEHLKSLSMINSNQHLYDQIEQLKKDIEIHEQQVVLDEMECEILESMLHDRKAQCELIKQRFNRKYGTLPKIELGLKIGIDEIKKDTIEMENTMKSVGTIYANLRSLQRLSKVREDDLQRQMNVNNQAQKNIAIEQYFKEQREEYVKKKKKDEERELNKQETELYEKIAQEIRDCEEQINEYSDNVALIMKGTRLSNNKEDILKLWDELLDMNQTFKDKVEEAEAEKKRIEDKLREEQKALKLIKTNKVTKTDVNDMPELSRKETELDKAQSELEKERDLFSQNQRIVAGYLAGFSKIFEEIEKKKAELGVNDIEIIPCTEENLEKVIGYLSYLVGQIVMNDKLKEPSQRGSKLQSQGSLS